MAAVLVAAFVVPARGSRNWHALAWLGVAAFMIALSADEAAQLHEWIGQRYADYAGENERVAASLKIKDVYKWLIVGVPLALLGTVFLLAVAWKWLREHPASAWLAIAGIACLLGAIAAEYVESQYFAELNRRFPGWRGQQATVEEGLELLGAALFLIAFLEYLRRHIQRRDDAAPRVS